MNKFRYDINGLRAYAVIFVVLFHFKILGFSGGFVGVDIFFVISGYLMTKITLDSILKNEFSLISFYLARAIRILPALIILISVIGILGWFLLFPDDYILYSKHAISSLIFLSNINYWLEAGDYFSSGAHNKILLHTWSLSVEWQFYLVLPIILLVVHKIINNKKILKLVLLLGFLISFIFSMTWSSEREIFSFFNLPTRAWEMLAGGLVYVYFKDSRLIHSKFVEIIGFICIFTSLLIFSEKTVWPSFNALLPVLGTALVIIAQNNNSLLTRNIFAQKIGNASYSIYLWHWPIVFYLNYLFYKPNIWMTVIAIVLSVFLGFLSYKFVENTSRRYLSSKSKKLSGFYILTSILILIFVFFIIIYKNGVTERFSKQYIDKTQKLVMPLPKNGWCFYSVDTERELTVGKNGLSCVIGYKGNTSHKAILFGDSYAGHYLPFWNKIGEDLKVKISALSTNWCNPSLAKDYVGLKTSRAYDQCLINREYVKENMKNFDFIIISNKWLNSTNDPQTFKNLALFLKFAQDLNKPVIIMPSPYIFESDIGKSYKLSLYLNKSFDISKLTNDKFDQKTINSDNEVKKISEDYKDVFFIDRSFIFNSNHLTSNGVPYVIDNNGHLGIIGSIDSAESFEKSSKYKEIRNFLDLNQSD